MLVESPAHSRLATSYIVWLIVALGMPFWLVIIPKVGLPLLTIWAVGVDIEILRFTHWRRQYELSIDCLIRNSTNRKVSQRTLLSKARADGTKLEKHFYEIAAAN